jgi:hypothetical protein
VQGLSQEETLARVRSFATKMASPRHLLSDVTLPILSLFSGRVFDKARASNPVFSECAHLFAALFFLL